MRQRQEEVMGMMMVLSAYGDEEEYVVRDRTGQDAESLDKSRSTLIREVC